MSVVDPRPAAAQRTAARRFRIVATWLVAVPMLAFFSFSVVAGASTYNGKPPVENALQHLPPTTTTVVEASAPTPGGLLDRLTHAATLVCTVDTAQSTALQHSYRTTTTSLTVNGRTVSILSVYGATEPGIRSYLGTSKCVLIQAARVFFLPFDAHTS
jgi:hypothetical protein